MKLGHLLAALDQAGCQPTPELVAEALWMLAHLPDDGLDHPPPLPPVGAVAPEPDSIAPPVWPTDAAPPPADAAPEQSAPPAEFQVPAGAGGPTRPHAALPVPGAAALPDAPELARALRPLARTVPAPRRHTLDLPRTIRRLIEQRVFVPELRPARERWLALHLLLDQSPSMGLWQQHLRELHGLLLRAGVFTAVRVWALDAAQADAPPRIRSLSRTGRPGETALRPQALVSPAGRTLVLVASDMVAAGWHSGAVARALAVWARVGPLALVQLLPERLWGRSALGGAVEVRLSSSRAGTPTAQLRAVVEEDWALPGHLPAGVVAPVLALDPAHLRGYAAVLLGSQGAAAGYRLAFWPRASAGAPLTPMGAPAQIERFLSNTSPLGIELIRLLAAAPVISLPIIRIIHASVLRARGGGPAQIVEVLLGGLLRPLLPHADPEAVIYDFIEGARPLLLHQASYADTALVFQMVTDYIAARSAAARHPFPALLAYGPVADDAQVASGRAFARATAAVLRELGHTDLARRLELEAPADPATAGLDGQAAGAGAATAGASIPAVDTTAAPLAWIPALLAQIAQLRAQTQPAPTLTERELDEDLGIVALHLQAAQRALQDGNLRRLRSKLDRSIRDLRLAEAPEAAPLLQELRALRERTTPTQFAHGYALVVSARQAGLQVPTPVPAPPPDPGLQALGAALTDPRRCGYAPDHVAVLLGDQATRQSIFDRLAWLAERAGADTDATVLICFSGDVIATDDGAYLLPIDGSRHSVEESAISVQALRAALQAIPTRRLLLMLNCAHVRIVTARSIQSPLQSTAVLGVALDPRLASAGERDAAGSGFARYLVDALEGATSAPDDIYVRVSTLAYYLSEMVSAATLEPDSTQTPLFDMVGEDFPIGLLLGGAGLPGGRRH